MKLYYFLLTSFLLFSCNSKTEQSELPEIPIDIDQNNSLKISEITEELTTIDLEFTDKSMVNPDFINCITILENNLIITGLNEILVFNTEGKFIRSIASRGQGPGEYNFIFSLAIDEKNKRLFILNSSPKKIICYDLNGKFIKESPPLYPKNAFDGY